MATLDGRMKQVEKDVIQTDSKWSKNNYLVPNESHIPGTKYSGLRTSDGKAYARNEFTGEIKSINKKVKGKKARRADKLARRLQREILLKREGANGKKEETTTD